MHSSSIEGAHLRDLSGLDVAFAVRRWRSVCVVGEGCRAAVGTLVLGVAPGRSVDDMEWIFGDLDDALADIEAWLAPE